MNRCLLALFLLAPAVQAQTVTGTFVRHTVRVTSDTNCLPGNAAPVVYTTPVISVPIRSSCGSTHGAEGLLTFEAPASTPPFPRKAGAYWMWFQSPMPVSLKAEGTFKAVSTGYTGQVKMTDPCAKIEDKSLPKGSTPFSSTFSCALDALPVAGAAGKEVLVVGWNVYVTVVAGFDQTRYVAVVQTEYSLAAAPPPPAPAADLMLDHVDLFQAVQTLDNSVPLVAGKSTAARVFAALSRDRSEPLAGVTALLRGYRGDTELAGSPLRPVNGAITVGNDVNRGAQNGALNFRLPREWTAAGALNLAAELVLPAGFEDRDAANNRLVREASFITPPQSGLTVSYWPVCTQPPGGDPACPPEAIADYDDLMRKLYPLADDELVYMPLLVPALVWTEIPSTWEKMSRLQAYLRKSYELMTGMVGDQLAAWLPNVNTGGIAGLSDPPWNKGRGATQRVTISKQWLSPLQARQTLAHETAHNFGLRHPNTPDGCRARDRRTDWPHPDATIQEFGFDPQTMQLVPYTRMEIMAYCQGPDPRWISPFSFNKLLNRGAEAAVKPAEAESPRRAESGDYLVLSGTVASDGSWATLDSAYRTTGGTAPFEGDPEGNHCLVFHGADGPLARYCFTLAFESHDAEEPLSEESFALKVAFPAGATRMALVRGEQQLAEMAASGEPPAVSITAPLAGERWSGAGTIVWSASDPGGAALKYAVLYSADGGATWLPLAIDLTAQQYTLETSRIRGGAEIWFRVLASNGAVTGTAEVGPVEIGQQARIAAPAALEFGGVLAGEASESLLWIANRGNGPLNVSAFTLPGAEIALATPELPLAIAPGARRAFPIRFSGATAGAYSGTLGIASDDPERPSITVALTAQVLGGVPARIEAAPESLDFGEVRTGESKDLQFTVRSAGATPLALSEITVSDQRFAVVDNPAPLTLDGGAAQTITVRYTPGTAGAHTGRLTLVSNDPQRGRLEVALRGSGQAPPPPAAPPRFSDGFDRADNSSTLGQTDNALGGSETRCYVPVFPNSGARIASKTLANNTLDYGGMQFGPSGCTSAYWGGTVGQDLRMRVDVLVPTDAQGRVTQAGPYFRGRAAYRGDGVIGGESAGYWVRLHSTGEVSVKNLHAATVVATSARPASFDAAAWHTLEIAAQGSALQVTLDGRQVTFSGGATVALPETGGSNVGTAGVAFGAEPNRGQIGGQRADNVMVWIVTR